jgi:hypothetical protein
MLVAKFDETAMCSSIAREPKDDIPSPKYEDFAGTWSDPAKLLALDRQSPSQQRTYLTIHTAFNQSRKLIPLQPESSSYDLDS